MDEINLAGGVARSIVSQLQSNYNRVRVEMR